MIHNESFNSEELSHVPGKHMNVLDVEFVPCESLPMKEIVIPMRLKRGCYQEFIF